MTKAESFPFHTVDTYLTAHANAAPHACRFINARVRIWKPILAGVWQTHGPRLAEQVQVSLEDKQVSTNALARGNMIRSSGAWAKGSCLETLH